MADQFDEYIDGFLTTTGPWGASLTFRRSPSITTVPGNAPQADNVGVIRMSLEHLKAMTYILRRQIVEHERRHGVNVQVPITILNSMNIAPEDWDRFWQSSEE